MRVVAVARANPTLAAWTLGYLVFFLVYGLIVGSDVAIPYIVLIGGLLLVAVQLDRHFALGTGILWCLSIWGAAHLAGGVIPIGGEGDRTLYNAWLLPHHALRFDQVVHAFGFGTATVACGIVLLRWLPGDRLSAGQAVLVVLAGLGVGAVNEIVEFVATLVLPDTNVGGYANTGWDLVADLAGGIVGALWLLRRSARPAP